MGMLTYNEIKRLLTEAGIEDAAYEAELLMLHFCPSLDKTSLAFSKNEPFGSEELCAAVEKRYSRYPLQYIIGSWYFCNEKYRVSPDCLIPRPETELLCELAAKLLPSGAEFLDLCTGSGCIAISTLAMRKDCRAKAVDLYDGALKMAALNAEDNCVKERLEIIKCDILSQTAADTVCGGKKYDAILSNPPYIKSDDLDSLAPELSAEPVSALDGGEDGLTFYRAIISQFAESLKEGGFMLFEAGADTAEGVAEVARQAGFSAQIIKDYSGLDRMILIR